MAAQQDDRRAIRTCPLCEATCGLEITLRDDEVVRIRGDREDVFSRGFICPKGSTLKHLEADPDRLRTPLVRRNGTHVETTWDEAFAVIADRLPALVDQHGPDAVAVYIGNPNVHTMSGPIYNRIFLRALGTHSIYTASTVDQMPKHLSSALMFGHPDLIPVPDLDRTDHLLVLGANPVASNGSLATAPDWPGRIASILERGGRVVVVDPRRSETAEIASEHVPIRPGTDALLLYAMVNVLLTDGPIDTGRLGPSMKGLDEVTKGSAPFTPEAVAAATGVQPDTIRRLAHEFAAAPSAVAYGRVGTHTTRYGTLASWLVDVLNAVTGNLDRPGGAMFAKAATERPRSAREYRVGRWRTRVNGRPEVRGELPVAELPDEILTPGDGRVRALVSIGGNPVLSNPSSDRTDAALSALDFMVSIDLYLNETSRHADVVLPVPPPLQRPHYDFAFTQLSVRNVANYSPAALARPPGTPDEWEIMLQLAAIAVGQGPDADIGAFDDFAFSSAVSAAVGDPRSPVHGRDPGEIVAATEGGHGPERWLDFLVRTGPYGDTYDPESEGLSLSLLRASPHGVDLGPLQPRLPGDLATPAGKIDLAPEMIRTDVSRLRQALVDGRDDGLQLIGRRHIRSNNSWMHNIDVLVRGRARCTLKIHPDDAAARGISDGGRAVVASGAGSVEAVVDVTDEMMPGVVSLPHGWGHDYDGTKLSTASRNPGVNVNRLIPGTVDPLSGNAELNGISRIGHGRVTGLVEEVVSPWYGRIQILSRDEEMSAAIRRGALWERRLVEVYSAHVRPGATAVDVGANLGCHSMILASLVGPGGRVVAYEPQPLLGELLRANTDAAGAAVAVRRVAVGSSRRSVSVTFPDYDLSTNPGGWSLGVGAGRESKQRIVLRGAAENIDVVRLDDEAEVLGRQGADLIKIDVEGMELDVLRGAERLLTNHGPALFVETRDHRDEVDEFLTSIDYCRLSAVGTPAGADYASVPMEREGLLRRSLAPPDA